MILYLAIVGGMILVSVAVTAALWAWMLWADGKRQRAERERIERVAASAAHNVERRKRMTSLAQRIAAGESVTVDLSDE